MKARKRKTPRPWTNEDTLLLMKYMEGSDINRKSIQEDILWDAGKFIRIHGNRKCGLLVGALEGRYDYYWIVEMSDLTLLVTSCVGGYDVVEDDIPQECSVLEYMRDNIPEDIESRVMYQLTTYFNEGDKLMSDIFFTPDR